MQNGDEGLPSIILTRRGLFVKMLITLEQYILINFYILISKYILPYTCLSDGHIMSELISGIIVSAFLEAINSNNQANVGA